MNKLLRASLASMVVVASAGCGASGNGPGASSSGVARQSHHGVVAAYSSANPSSPLWNPPIDKVWMVGHSEALVTRPPKHPSQAVMLVHRLLKAGVRAPDAPPVTVPQQARHPVTSEPVGPPTLHLKNVVGNLSPVSRLQHCARDFRVGSGHVDGL